MAMNKATLMYPTEHFVSRGQQMESTLIRARGRDFTNSEIEAIRTVVQEKWPAGRSQISIAVCKLLGWFQENGRLKDRACRDALRSLENLGMISLPPSKCKTTRIQSHKDLHLPPDHRFSPSRMDSVVIDNITSLSISMVRWTNDEKLWNSLVSTYHYLGYSIIVGRHLKYIVFERDIPVACLGWGDAAWNVQDRDIWIGWDDEKRRKNLKFVINNVRFLILPWLKVPNFASFILSRGIKLVEKDWQRFYGVKPLLLETFVEKERFKGTCYRAANWVLVGSTKGFARRGYSHYNHQTIKDIYTYPIHRDARALLKS